MPPLDSTSDAGDIRSIGWGFAGAMTHQLENRHCTPCRGGVPPLDEATARAYLAERPEWQLGNDGKRIERGFRFKTFAQALDFVNAVGAIAEAEGHHPDILFGWG